MSTASMSRTPRGSGPGGKITRADLEAKLNELRGDVEQGVETAKGIGFAVAAGVAVVLVLGAYLAGRRKGRKRSTIVEIRRI
jgi:hypothetical protein